MALYDWQSIQVSLAAVNAMESYLERSYVACCGGQVLQQLTFIFILYKVMHN